MDVFFTLDGSIIFKRYIDVANSNDCSNCSTHEHLNRQWIFFYQGHILSQTSLSTPVYSMLVVYNAQYDLHFVTCINVFVSDWPMFQNTAFLLVEKMCHMTRSRDITFFIDSTGH